MESPEPKHGLLVHEILAHGYLIYIAVIVLALFLDYFVPIHFSSAPARIAGFVLGGLGTWLIFWAQRSSRKTAGSRNEETLSPEHFSGGPYKYTRSPTQYGLALLMMALGCIYGMAWMFVLGTGALILGRLVIIRSQERHLSAKYGQPYDDYKKKVKL